VIRRQDLFVVVVVASPLRRLSTFVGRKRDKTFHGNNAGVPDQMPDIGRGPEIGRHRR